ncbi:MAG: helix-turn-helix transcriptional regulator [Mycobacteriales bacterium]
MKNVTASTYVEAIDEDVLGELRRTRDRVRHLLLERGRATAAELGEALGLGPAAIRRHLDGLTAQGRVERRDPAVHGQRHRGRPACDFVLTPVGRSEFPHAYDDLALAALRQLREIAGTQAVTELARHRFSRIERRCEAAMTAAGSSPHARINALATVLSAEGYAADVSAIASGAQLCQHHCPVATVAAEFPQLCEVETAAIARLSGRHVQRLATIAHGDGVCTTHIPLAAPAATGRPSVTTPVISTFAMSTPTGRKTS